MPLSFALIPPLELLAMLALSSLPASGDTFGVEVREKVFARGPRCVSLSSAHAVSASCNVRYDMMKYRIIQQSSTLVQRDMMETDSMG
jgi:hypothetical protein